jgi:hypothetical protein
MRDTIDMLREAGWASYASQDERFKAFEALVRADEREEANRSANASWTLMCEKMVAIEREACAQIADLAEPYQTADLIRARGNT